MTNKFFFTCVLFLIILKIAAVLFTNFSLFADEAQYWLWSRSLDFGYFSKPPLLAWCLRAYTEIFGSSFDSLKFFSMPFYLFSSFFIFLICKKLGLGRDDSLYCALIFFIIPAVSFSSFIVSTDVILVLLWTILLNLVLIVREKPTNFNFFLIGVFFGLAFLSKYAAIYFLLCLFVFVIFDKKIKQILRKKIIGILIFVSVSLVLVLPNLIWNYYNGWITFSHTVDNANLENYSLSFLRGISFLFIQILMIGPVLFLGFVLNIKKFRIDFQNIYLLSFSIPIILVVFFESVIVRANANWAAPALISLLILFFRLVKNYKLIIKNTNFLFNFFLGLFLFFAIAQSMPLKIFDRISGIDKFASEVSSMTNINKFVVSDRMLFSSLSYELRRKEIEIFMPYNPEKPISNHFQINSSLKKNMSENFILIGSPENISYLSEARRIKLIKKIKKKFMSDEINIYEVNF